MKTTGDQSLVKKINKTIVLDTIKQHAPVSRAQISELTGLNKGTVSSLVAELVREHYVYETGIGASSGGRKPILLCFHSEAGYTVGIDLGVPYILAVVTDLLGEVVMERELPLARTEPQTVIAQIVGCVQALMREIPPSPYGVVGVGIGVPGIVNEEGTVLFAPNLNWTQVSLRGQLAEQLQLPVSIDNEANTGALGEQQFGVGRESSNMIYISAGIGLGAGIVINRELYRGTAGYSGEAGHATIDLRGPVCRCGNVGCWELYASEQALLEKARHLFPEEAVNLEQLIGEAEQGNRQVIELFGQIGQYLGVGVANLVNIFNPERVVIGNRFSLLQRWLEEPVRKSAQERCLPFHRDGIRIVFSRLGSRSSALGAAHMASAKFLAGVKVTVE